MATPAVASAIESSTAEAVATEDESVSTTTPPVSSSSIPTTPTPTPTTSSSSLSSSSTPKEKLDHVWKHIVAKSESCPSRKSASEREWPSYNDVFNDVRKSDYNEMLTCPLDLHTNREREKKISALGIVCCAKMELFDFPTTTSTTIIKGRPYSGFLTPGTTAEHCLIRFSSALQPMKTEQNKHKNQRMARMMFGQKLTDARLFPAVAMKLFRRGNNMESANLLLLGCKVGQPEDDFFAHCLCSQITSRMPVTLKPILKIFQKYSEHPLALGLSNLCTYSEDGEMCNDLNFPFCLTFKPCYKTSQQQQPKKQEDGENKNDNNDNDNKEADFLDNLRNIPVGSVLYDVFASPTPLSVADPSKLQRIGRIISTSEMIDSVPDDGLFFRHQKKDEDYQLRPDWKKDLSTPVTLKDGTKGTAATLAGWELFEHQIEDGGYIDFEATK